jgi:hypothetical protein
MAVPSVRPPSVRARDSAPASAAPKADGAQDSGLLPQGPVWIAFWVVLALASIAAGVYFALKR